MAATTSTKDAKATGPAPLVPPEEKFWKRYSPHGEAPLSLAGSLAVHALGIGGLVLVAIYLAALLFKPNRSLPVETVRVVAELPGGGGGGGQGGKGVGTDVLREDVPGEKNEGPSSSNFEEVPNRPRLTSAEKSRVEEKFDPVSARIITQSSSETANALARLDDGLRRKLSDAVNRGAAGQGGTGKGGGSGTGDGQGIGPGSGDGKATLSKREKRMLRWHMRFTANTGPEYLAQLRGLGAILAFPVKEGPEPVFKVVRDLKPGAKLLDEDVAKLNRIFWIDDKPQSVIDILAALRIRLPRLPTRFVAFMPESLEKRLFEMERKYILEELKRPNFNEDEVNETTFRVVLTPSGYQPELVSVSLR